MHGTVWTCQSPRRQRQSPPPLRTFTHPWPPGAKAMLELLVYSTGHMYSRDLLPNVCLPALTATS